MYLCNLKMKGQTLPSSLPDSVRNEVSSMVDIISFGVPDEAPTQPARTNVPDFRTNTASPPAIQQPQPQQSNSSIISQLMTQPTGMMPQMTGYPGQAGFGQQNSGGLQSQVTGYPGMQGRGYSGPRPPMPPMSTGFSSNPVPPPLNSQPTGMPGQWGLVNAPASGLPNLQALQQQMMPQSGRESGFTTAGLTGNANVPWAITKDEKQIYDQMFKAWDGLGKGFINGAQALEIFGQSGLAKSDLERTWTLSDPGNRGKLTMDEFAVAMHLIYRKLNGYPLPSRLPPELTPPSARNLNASLDTVKGLLSRDAEERKISGAYLQPQKTGVNYMKSHSMRSNSPLNSGRDAMSFKNNDEDMGFRSSARRRVGNDGRSPSPANSASPTRSDDMTADQMRKLIREKQVLLEAIDFRDEGAAEEDELLDRRDRRDADDLYRRIRRVQEDIDRNPNASAMGSGDSEAERRTLRRQLQVLNDRLPDLASQVRRCERAIADAQLELFRMQDAKAHPNSSANIVGTGPGGTVTESDKLKARARALMQQRSAALSGKAVANNDDDPAAGTRRLEAETSRIKTERENNERLVADIEESVNMFGKSLEDSLNEGKSDSATDHERRRWEDALGVEEEVRDFIFDLQRESKSTRGRRSERTSERSTAAAVTSAPSSAEVSSPRPADTPASRSSVASPAPDSGSSYSSYKTADERAAYIKKQAEIRMQERLAALGLRAPGKPGESAQERQAREEKEAEDRRRRADEEDAKRDAERRRRLEGESIAPPSTGKDAKKAPPPPPTRKDKASIAQHDIQQAEAESNRANNAIAEQAVRDQQSAEEAERKRLE